jgi:hypothetical protein
MNVTGKITAVVTSKRTAVATSKRTAVVTSKRAAVVKVIGRDIKGRGRRLLLTPGGGCYKQEDGDC